MKKKKKVQGQNLQRCESDRETYKRNWQVRRKGQKLKKKVKERWGLTVLMNLRVNSGKRIR